MNKKGQKDTCQLSNEQGLCHHFLKLLNKGNRISFWQLCYYWNVVVPVKSKGKIHQDTTVACLLSLLSIDSWPTSIIPQARFYVLGFELSGWMQEYIVSFWNYVCSVYSSKVSYQYYLFPLCNNWVYDYIFNSCVLPAIKIFCEAWSYPCFIQSWYALENLSVPFKITIYKISHPF